MRIQRKGKSRSFRQYKSQYLSKMSKPERREWRRSFKDVTDRLNQLKGKGRR